MILPEMFALLHLPPTPLLSTLSRLPRFRAQWRIRPVLHPQEASSW